ncbi:hypothetical protein VDR45_01385 [Xanthomonas campestris pv. campestris]|nr:hypothetical protein [Xanthomonas campestris pv. campestris]
MTTPDNLFLVEHTDKGNAPQLVEQLDPYEIAMLSDHFRGHDLPNQDRVSVIQRIQSLIAKRWWVACGCKGDLSKDSPLLFPRSVPRSAARPAVLVPLYERNPHIPGCDFERDKPDSADTPGTQERKPLSGLMGVLPQMRSPLSELTSNLAKPERHRVCEAKQSKRTPTLARVLFTLLEAAELNIVKDENRATHLIKDRLREVMKHYFVGKDKPLLDWCTLSFSTYTSLLKKLDAQQQKNWGKVIPQSFIIDQVRQFESNKSTHVLTNAFGDELRFSGKLIVPGENTPSPWLAIALASKRPRSAAEIDRVYLHPVDGETEYFLVDSDLERQTLRFLRRRLSQMTRANRPYTIIKPLIDLKVTSEDGEARVRPDFIVRAKKGDLIVETMGYEDTGYITRKQSTHDLMKLLPSFERLFAHQKGSDKDLMDTLDRHIA